MWVGGLIGRVRVGWESIEEWDGSWFGSCYCSYVPSVKSQTSSLSIVHCTGVKSIKRMCACIHSTNQGYRGESMRTLIQTLDILAVIVTRQSTQIAQISTENRKRHWGGWKGKEQPSEKRSGVYCLTGKIETLTHSQKGSCPVDVLLKKGTQMNNVCLCNKKKLSPNKDRGVTAAASQWGDLSMEGAVSQPFTCMCM